MNQDIFTLSRKIRVQESGKPVTAIAPDNRVMLATVITNLPTAIKPINKTAIMWLNQGPSQNTWAKRGVGGK